ncbi:hypothetical protein GGF38_001487, partial [Coemansia sp. RSA 25]
LTMTTVRAAATAADIANFRGAILVKNGIPTSCELALIDNQAAFVAANCLDYKSGQVSADTKYEVYFDGAKGNAPGRATINPGDIYVNGFYDPTSYANNVAVVKFDFSAQGAWRNFFAVNRLEWNNIVYVRRQLLNAAEDSMAAAWSTPAVVSQLNSDSGCAKASGLFSSNQDDMLCSKQSVTSPVSDRCSLPYGSLYGVASRAMAVSALYSHTVTYGNKMCNNGGGDAYHFYTQLSNYTRFARHVLGRKLSEYIENADQYLELRHITSYRMRYPESDNDQGTSMFGGDIFAVQRMELNLKPPQQMQPPPLPPPQPPPPPANTATTTVTTTTKTQAEQGQATSFHPSSSPSLPAMATRPDDAAAGASKDASSTATPSTSKENNVSDRPTSLIDPADFPPGFGTGGVTRVDHDDDDDDKHDSSKHSSESTSQSTSAEQNKAGSGGQSNDGDGFKGVSKSTVIALAVTIPLLVIMASVGSYFMYKSHRKRKFNILQSNGLNFTFRGATLVKNGQPTSCEFGLIDNQSAFLAANCLDFKDGQVNQATKYEIYFDKAKGQGPGRATLIPDKIRVHPLYNPTSFANNIAVVEFSYSDQGSWINYISVNSLEWTSMVNVRRQLLSPSANSWGDPVVQTQTGNAPDCFKASALFKSNVRDMVCSVLSLSSPVSNKCSAPYGTLYGVSEKSMAVSAIYSHSVVYNSNMCSGGNTFHYFTMLSNYTRYASSVLGRRVYEYIENTRLYDTMWHTTSHHFQNVNAMNAAGTSQFGGD